jgi:hypothetical protein
MWAFRYLGEGGTQKTVSHELEFRVVLPDGREIQEFVAGAGAPGTEIEAAIANFALSTFHTVYAVCFNPDDSHVQRQAIEINGQNFTMTTVGLFHLSTSETEINFDPVREQIQKAIRNSNLKLGKQLHWMKVVYGQNQNKPIVTSVTYDNLEADELTNSVKDLDWPKSEGFYMAKQFFMFEPIDE